MFPISIIVSNSKITLKTVYHNPTQPVTMPNKIFSEQDFATRQKINRAITVLNNYQLLMKYALANDQVSCGIVELVSLGLL